MTMKAKWYHNHPMGTLNVRPAIFYTKPFVYSSVAICLIMIKLLHHII